MSLPGTFPQPQRNSTSIRALLSLRFAKTPDHAFLVRLSFDSSRRRPPAANRVPTLLLIYGTASRLETVVQTILRARFASQRSIYDLHMQTNA